MKKSIFSVLMIVLLFASILPVYAADSNTGLLIAPNPIVEQEPLCYISVDGEVSTITNTDYGKLVSLVVDNEVIANLVVNEDTFILDNKDIKVGDKVTGYIDWSRPTIMIYPPQYVAEVIVVKSNETLTYAGIFDENSLSDYRNLKLNISDETKIITKDGIDFDGLIANKKVLVEYSFATKSIPMQTTPSRIIVLEDIFTIENKEYSKVVGEIETIRNNSLNGLTYLDVKISDDVYAVFVLNENTYQVDKDLKVGDIVEGYYDITRPMIAIYPPQYTIEVIRKQSDEANLFVGVFNKDYVDYTSVLKLNDISKVAITFLDGKEYNGDIVGKNVAVFYTTSTRSIPAQTTPTKIVILENSVKNTIINGQIVGKSYIKNDSVMLPLRTIMENMGYEVDWVGSTMSININGTHSIAINSLKCVTPNLIDIVLNESPEIINGSTYISIDYFKSFCNFVIEDATTITLNAGRCATPNFGEFYLNEQ